MLLNKFAVSVRVDAVDVALSRSRTNPYHEIVTAATVSTRKVEKKPIRTDFLMATAFTHTRGFLNNRVLVGRFAKHMHPQYLRVQKIRSENMKIPPIERIIKGNTTIDWTYALFFKLKVEVVMPQFRSVS